jgi:hypothetical protein
MLEELLAITNLVDFEDYGSLRLISVEWSEDTLILSLKVSADEYPEVHPSWQVVCSGVRDDCLSLGILMTFRCRTTMFCSGLT